VENGIKHGISRYTQGGIVHLSTNVQEDTLYIKIRNTGEYKPANQRKEGYGLKSTRQRLDLLFHRKASFDIVNEGEKMVLTTVALPRWDEGELVAVQRSENGMAD
jgi:LytS/YehU family sensor histidine kinase